MIVCWTAFALFTTLAVICWHYFTAASTRGDFYAIQSFEGGMWLGIIGAILMLAWNIIWHVRHSA